jgi:hypothetical protein
MENRNIFWGVLLVAIGSLFILDNLEVIDFSFGAFVDLWPLLLVGWGISVLPIKSVYKTVGSLLIAVFALFYASTTEKDFWWENNGFHGFRHGNVHFNSRSNFDDDENDSIVSEEDTYYTFKFDEELDSKITKAKLEMDVAAGKFRIDDPVNDHLISFEAYSNIGPYNSNMVTNGDQADIFINMDDASVKSGTNRNRAHVKLNPKIDWDLHFNMGAADFRGNFQRFKVSNIDIDGGASSIKIKLGELQKETHIKMDAAAASIKIEIPEGAGCRISSDSFLVDLDLQGFAKDADGDYVSSNYKNSDQKVVIEIDAAISRFSVRRY